MNLWASRMLALLLAFPAVAAGGDCDALTARLSSAEGLDAGHAEELGLLFPPLCAFLTAELDPEALAVLWKVATPDDVRRLLAEATGKDLFDFGERMFAHFEHMAPRPVAQPAETVVVESEHFVFVMPAGSPAAHHRDLIVESSEKILQDIVELLEVAPQLEANRHLLLTTVRKPNEPEPARHPRKIAVYLHDSRGEAASQIPEHSQGVASLGATVVGEGSVGTPWLTSRIDVLFFNPFSLLVLHHEIAHAATLVGSFDGSQLAGRTVRGRRALSRAFFAGHREIPSFLHEAIADYAFYYRGFHRLWPLLVGTPEELVLNLRRTGTYIPLPTLLAEGKRFRAAHHKPYSLQGAVFVRFLEETRGAEPLRAWLFSNQRNGPRSFGAIYGATIESVEAEWLTWLEGRAGAETTAPGAMRSPGP